VSWDEGLPDFHFAGFPCTSGNLMAYALSDEGSSESVILINLDKNAVAARVDLIKRSELEDAIENERGVSKANIQSRIASANNLFKGTWTYVHYAHGTDELETEGVSLGGFSFNLTISNGAVTLPVPLSAWYGKHKTLLSLSDIALVERWGFVAKSNADGTPEVLRIIPWKDK
jgi:hypothetical protein